MALVSLYHTGENATKTQEGQPHCLQALETDAKDHPRWEKHRGSICQYLHIPREWGSIPCRVGLDQPTGTTPAASALCPSTAPKDRARIQQRGPGALLCYFISGFELQDLPGSLDVVSLTPGGFSWGLCSSQQRWEAPVPAFHLTAAQLNQRDAELILGRGQPERDSSNTKTRGKCWSL